MYPVTHKHPSSKRVRFSPDPPVRIDLGGTGRDMRRFWYSRLDLVRFRANVKTTCLNGLAIDAQNDHENSYTRIMELVLDACERAGNVGRVNNTEGSVLTSSLQDLLEQCLKDRPELHGLHKYCVKNFAQHMCDSHAEIVAVIKERKESGSYDGSIGNIERVTRPYLLFAQVIAQAAAKAA